MMYIILGIVIWVIVGVWFFLSILGDKYRKPKWYDMPLSLGAIVVIDILLLMTTLYRYIRGEE